MATKKTEAVEEKKPVEVKEPEATEVKEPEVKEPEDNRVMIMIPYIEGEDPEVTVWVNDKVTKIRKGHQVKVTPEVAEVLANANQQMMVAMENRRKLKNQHQDW